MTDISMKFLADKLGKDLENISKTLETQLNQAVADAANAAYANIIANAQQQLTGTRQDYLKSLNFTKLGDNSYLISLEGKHANAIEDGFVGFDMKTGMLNSTKIVQVGSRAGEKWVKKNKEGKKYATVPFEHSPFSKVPKTGDLAKDIKKLTALNRQGIQQKLTSTFKDDLGKPLVGKVATASSEIAKLDKMTKFQHVSEKGKVSSIYMTFRRVSEDSDGWFHKGYKGLHAFEQAEAYVERELENILNTLL